MKPAEKSSGPETKKGKSSGGSRPNSECPPVLKITYCFRKQAEIEAHAAYVPYYLGTRLMGPAVDFERRIAGFGKSEKEKVDDRRTQKPSISLKRLIDLGIVVGNLGSLSVLPIPHDLTKVNKDPVRTPYVIFGGLGEPGSLSRDDIRFLMTNVVYGVKAIRPSIMDLETNDAPFELSTSLIGTYSRSLNAKQSLRATVEGIVEGMKRFGLDKLNLTIVVDDLLAFGHPKSTNENTDYKTKLKLHFEDRFKERIEDLKKVHEGECEIEFVPSKCDDSVSIDLHFSGTDQVANVDDGKFTRVTITAEQMTQSQMPNDYGKTSSDKSRSESLRWIDFKYSALTSNAAVPVRTVRIQKHFVEYIPQAVLSECDHQGQWEYGNLMMHFFIPDDFQKLIDEKEGLTLIVDRFTASFPWEMAGFSSKSENAQKFYGTDMEISRQFRSVLGSINAHAPEIDNALKILIIADPVSNGGNERFALEGARKEGEEIAILFAEAQLQFGDTVEFEIDLRVGNRSRDSQSEHLNDLKGKFKKFDDWNKERNKAREKEGKKVRPNFVTVDHCNPIEILKLLVHKRYDIVHFAGHGRYVPETGDMGWMLDGDCTLTAKEIFRVRHVPRLVFANACRSSIVDGKSDQASSEDTSGKLGGMGKISKSEEKATHGDEKKQHLYVLPLDDLGKLELLDYQVSMAEAFFSRGIPNFIGTGWNVADDQAKTMAIEFYKRILDMQADDPSIGKALKNARALLKNKKDHKHSIQDSDAHHENHSDEESNHSQHISWGAYQHYGLPSDVLFRPVPKHDIGTKEPT